MKIKWLDTDEEDIEISIKAPKNHPQKTILENLLAQLEGFLIGVKNNMQYRILFKDVYYIENQEDTSTLYTKSDSFSSRYRLYEFEQFSTFYVRINKNMVVNLLKVQAFKSSLNGKLELTLINGDRLEISRHYVSSIKQKLKEIPQ